MVGPSKDYNDALLAHELSHVILISRGFSGAHTVPPPKRPESTESARAIQFIMRQLGDCFPDELIDRQTSKRGFTPKLLLGRQIDLIVQDLALFQVGEYESVSDLVKQAEALKLFCLGKRLAPSEMQNLENRVKLKYGPSIIEREKRLSTQFQDQRCGIDDPPQCVKLTLELRDFVGMNGTIFFANPKTHKWE